jgi:hypothetical protein
LQQGDFRDPHWLGRKARAFLSRAAQLPCPAPTAWMVQYVEGGFKQSRAYVTEDDAKRYATAIERYRFVTSEIEISPLWSRPAPPPSADHWLSVQNAMAYLRTVELACDSRDDKQSVTYLGEIRSLIYRLHRASQPPAAEHDCNGYKPCDEADAKECRNGRSGFPCLCDCHTSAQGQSGE